ncbi:MAG: phosphate acyltransferase PlsX [Nitrospirae bacterium]|nr:phosphate acyltransferase PlsX [Nitrospirota bacterium]MBI3351528.1 phosphate acyltransferase PlsX [Nitrospirota bacterium]
MKIALDAMGGDFSPQHEVEGAIAACEEFGVELILVGDEKRLSAELKKYSTANLPVTILHADQVVTMEDAPSMVIRKKRNSSIWKATELVMEGTASAVVSAGNTGACMAAAIFILKPLKGIDRPAIAAIFPTLKNPVILIDVGANVDCKPKNLLQFAVMGDVYAKRIFGLQKPRIGLLSNGEEDIKGNDITKEAFKLLKAAPFNFLGNVEGKDIYKGETDVIVCDGFVGNVVLKTSEGLAEALFKLLKFEIRQSTILGKLGYPLLKSSFTRFKKRVDYSEYGGAPLLGVNGVSMICHGRSTPKAIKNAIGRAKNLAEKQVSAYIQSEIEAFLMTEPAS